MTLHLTLQDLYPLLGSAELDTPDAASPVLSREHLLQPAGNTLPSTAQEAVCRLCHGSALLAHRLLPTSTPSYFSAELSPSWSAPQCYFTPDVEFCNSPCCTWKFHSAQMSSLAGSLWMQIQPCGIWTTPLCFVPPVNLLGVQCPSIKAINEDARQHLPQNQLLGLLLTVLSQMTSNILNYWYFYLVSLKSNIFSETGNKSTDIQRATCTLSKPLPAYTLSSLNN